MKRVLLVNFSPKEISFFSSIFGNKFEIKSALDSKEAEMILSRFPVSVMITMIPFKGEDCFSFIEKIKKELGLLVFVISKKKKESFAVKLLNIGVDAYFRTPLYPIKKELSERIWSKLVHLSSKRKKVNIGLIKKFLEENYYKDISFADIQRVFGGNKRTIYRNFFRKYGTSIMKYLEDIRIFKACERLRQTDLSINKIGELVGYKSISYFSRVFKKRMMVSPSEYRKNFRTDLKKNESYKIRVA
ncbi:MAG: DNA-binding response regulator [Deltaproteobacteria bacterium]|nr:DNA-binding response regulator [Deltaproteobacteria bacterium]